MFGDGDEVACGSNPRDSMSFCVGPDGLPNFNAFLPRMEIAPRRLAFVAYTHGSNPPGQRIVVTNTGAGTLKPQATSDAPWLTTSVTRAETAALVNKAGLSRGHYQGKITITNASGGLTQNSPQTVTVDLYVYEDTGQALQLNGLPSNAIFLPLVQK
jgi:hypothetical protein